MARETRGKLPEQVPEERYLEPGAKPGSRDALTLGVLAAGIAGLLYLGTGARRWL